MTAAFDDVTGALEGTRARRASFDATIVLAPIAIAIAVAGLSAATRDEVVAADWVRLILVSAWTVAGVSSIRHPAVQTLGRLILVGATLGATAFTAARYADVNAGTGADVAALVAPLACLWLIALSAHALLALPDGHLVTRSRQIGTGIGYAAATIAAVFVWAGPGELSVAAGALAWTLAVAVGLPGAHRRYLVSTGVERQRLQWIGCGAALAGEVAITMAALRLFIGWPVHAGAIAALGTALIPLAVTASTSTRLAPRVDRALVHTVSLVGLTVVVIAVYVLVVLGLGRTPTDDERELLGLSMIAAGVAALVYLPARERLADLANRLVYGEQRAPDEALRTFGQRLTRAIPMDELLLQLVESLRKSMTLSAAEIWTGTGDVLERAASVPDRGPGALSIGPRERPVIARAGVTGNAWLAVWLPELLNDRAGASLRVAPISHSGELLGAIVVERPSTGDSFTDEDDRVLTELARQVGLALHNVQLDSALQASLDEVRRQAEELRASRARIVATGDAERRKIERNLHDGAQQHLVALAVNLRLTRDIIADDPAAAVEMLDALATEVKDTIQEVRDLAHGIYPPLLLDSGLVEALKAAASRSPLSVEVVADGLERYPTEVEAAIYFCCLEALQNAGKHAPDASVVLRLWEEEGGLLFEVADDGPGYDAEVARQGHGYINMSDRIGAIGGTVRWDSTPGHGATVHGSVPLSET